MGVHVEELRVMAEGEEVGRYFLGDDAVEVGSAQDCDLVVADTGVDARHALLKRQGGTVMMYLLGGDAEARVVPLGTPIPLGHRHRLLRCGRPASKAATRRANTHPLLQAFGASPRLTILIGHGPDARRLTVDDEPVSIGTDARNRIRLCDPTVSGSHCRIERSDAGIMIRDLRSRNGTYVNGVRVRVARLRVGSLVRVGRTDLRLVQDVRMRRGDVDASDMVIASDAMAEVMAHVSLYADVPQPVLILGESGVGKEGVARALHLRSKRAAGPFVAVNAGGIPPHLIESELFGHEKGAFTGASHQRRGVFEQADGGTLFLDEIGELPMALQSRLLRVLEDWRVSRVGGESSKKVNVRLVCATHRDLRRQLEDGSFRTDLFFRLARMVVEVPPLRARVDDIGPLAERFLQQQSEWVGRRSLTKAALSRLLLCEWRGNVRELRNVISFAALHAAGETIEICDVERAMRKVGATVVSERLAVTHLKEVVELYHGNLAAAARSLGMARSTLRYRLAASGRKR